MQLRCVIVDDDVTFLDAARALLERDGMTVAGVARTCAETVRGVEALRPDVVLIDIRLGGESGFDVARQLAADGQAAALIMISTDAGEDYADVIADQGHELRRIARLSGDVEAAALQQAGQTLAEQDVIVGHHHAGPFVGHPHDYRLPAAQIIRTA